MRRTLLSQSHIHYWVSEDGYLCIQDMSDESQVISLSPEQASILSDDIANSVQDMKERFYRGE